jgi:GNAT superfamily N-acetyltransferase
MRLRRVAPADTWLPARRNDVTMSEVNQIALRTDGQVSDYDWFNVQRGDRRIGKVRAHVHDDCLTIYSMTIFPEYQGQGYGEAVVERFKASFETIVADRVRPGARGFWEHEGFASDGCGNYVFPSEPLCGDAEPAD